MIIVVHRDRLYVPRDAVDMRAVRTHCEVPHQTKAHCHPGCTLASRPGRFCSTCPGRDARVRLWEEVVTPGGLRLVAMASGDLRVLQRVVIGAYRVVDRRADPPYRSALRWTGHLRAGGVDDAGRAVADQRGMLRAWRSSVASGQTGGVVQAAPRTGKCILPDSMIRTCSGYHHISHLFGGRETRSGVEEIGAFGTVAAPGGVRDVRGLYATTVDAVVHVRMAAGLHLGGTPNHRIRVMGPLDEPLWVRLGDLTGHERVLIARDTSDPVSPRRGLAVEVAALVGTCLRVADYARFSTGILNINGDLLDEQPELATMLRGMFRLHHCAGTDLMADMRGLPVLRDWPALLMASTHDAWRAFARSAAVMDDEDENVHVRVPDVDVARALQMHLLAHGVMCALIPDRGGHRIDVMDEDQWDGYCENRPPDPHDELWVPIVEVRRVLRPHVVMDIRVPQGRAYYANGVVSHNTVIGVAASLAERTRTFITATKIDFLRQFGRRFGELTNLRHLYAAGQRPVVLVDPAGWPDGVRYGVHVVKRWGPEAQAADVVMSSAQQFLDTARGNARLQTYLVGRFGLVVADECHQAAAVMFLDLVGRSDARRKLGLTATIQRKDKLEPVLLKTIGPVVARGRVASIRPYIELLETGVGVGRDYTNWAAMTSFLVNLEERNRIILRQVFADLRANALHTVVVTTTRRDHIATLVKMINANALHCNTAKDEDWPAELAVAYRGGSDTNAVLNMAGSGRTRVVVAMVSMVQLGLDVARWTHVYLGVVPTSNPYNVYQLVNRVCTPYPPDLEAKIGPKPRVVARVCIDAISASVFCFSKLFLNAEYGFRAGLTAQNDVGVPLYEMTPTTLARATAIARHPRSYSPEDVGVAITLGKTRTGKRRRRQAWRAQRDGITSI